MSTLLFLARRRLLSVIAVVTLQACTLGPNYKRPELPSQATWRERNDAGSGTLSENWWELFGDGGLSKLEEEALAASPSLQQATARVMQARALARVSEADFYPNLSLDPEASRSRQSGTRPVQPGSTVFGYVSSKLRLPLDASYEIDFWGRVRRTTEAANARLEATEANYQIARLSLTSDVAQTYFTLRSIDAERTLLQSTLTTRRRALELVNARLRGGIAGELDVSRAETELATTEVETIAIERRRTELEAALATLLGKPAGQFTLPPDPLDVPTPGIPAGLPAQLLQRRPDVVEAERLLRARNAEIGVAQASRFPSVRLTGSAGYESDELHDLLKTDSRIWSIGPSISLPMFDAGRNEARVQAAQAAYEENLAQYRQRVLVAFQEVESTLGALRLLSEQSLAQARAVASAGKTAHLASVRYKAGLVGYLDVIDAQRTHLQNQRLAVQTLGLRLVGSVALVKALGGGWQAGTQAKG